MLAKFNQAKQTEVQKLIELEKSARLPTSFKGTRPPFTISLAKSSKCPVIAEYKRASPSAGDINLSLPPEAAAKEYAGAGAGAISVLTEETYFKGSLDYLERMASCGLPLLRKDFIIHPLQVVATAATPASAMLVIVRMLDETSLREVMDKTNLYGLEAVVEIFDERDLERARRAGAKIIQVNSRDLDTMKVDHTFTRQVIHNKLSGEFWICASGIDSHEALENLISQGYDAALVGSSLMREENPGDALRNLLGKGRSVEGLKA